MFGKIRTWHKIAAVSSKWASTTGIDAGDRGQVVNAACDYVKNLGFHPEDAWLTALVNWMDGMPWQDCKEVIAHGIFIFLEAHEGKVALSAGAIINAREHAYSVLSNGCVDTPHPNGKKTTPNMSRIEPNTKPKGHDNPLRNLPPGARVSLASDTGQENQKALSGLAKELYDKMLEDDLPEGSLPEEQGRLDKNLIYAIAVTHVCSELISKGYEIVFRGNSRGDSVSIIANYGYHSAYILVAAAQHPQEPLTPDFMKNRLIKDATEDGAEYYIARVTLRNSKGVSEDEKSKIFDKGSIEYIYGGLRKS
ncbi:MAG: hypothetical protein Q8P85_14950 [Pseudomonas sp.]|nr:hypothetical protein [Pseudomonas sp.]